MTPLRSARQAGIRRRESDADVFTPADIHIYVVNLKRRPDRRRRVESALPSKLSVTYTSDWEGPFDGRELDVAALTELGYGLFPWPTPSDNEWWSRPLKLGETGCTLSHLACWRHAVGTGAPLAAILEDDAVVRRDFAMQLLDSLHQLDSLTWDLLYLGRYPLQPDRPVRPGLVVPGYSHCTFGYVLTRRALTTVLAAGLERAIIPIDEFLPAMYIDHPRADVRARYPKRLRALAFEPPLVGQLPKHEAGSDTEASVFVDQ